MEGGDGHPEAGGCAICRHAWQFGFTDWRFRLTCLLCPLPKAKIRHCLAPSSMGKDAVLAGKPPKEASRSVPWVWSGLRPAHEGLQTTGAEEGRGSWHVRHDPDQQQGDQALPSSPAPRTGRAGHCMVRAAQQGALGRPHRSR